MIRSPVLLRYGCLLLDLYSAMGCEWMDERSFRHVVPVLSFPGPCDPDLSQTAKHLDLLISLILISFRPRHIKPIDANLGRSLCARAPHSRTNFSGDRWPVLVEA